MGQDTECDFGIAYHCKFNVENYEFIKKLARINKMHVYIHYGDGGGDDEKLDIIDALYSTTKNDMVDYNETLKKLKHNIEHYYLTSGSQYKGTLDEVELIFHYIVITGYARNISRRRNPTIYGEVSEGPRDIIEKLEEGITIFTNIGVPENELESGYLMHDW